jgi:hypothetical protein
MTATAIKYPPTKKLDRTKRFVTIRPIASSKGIIQRGIVSALKSFCKVGTVYSRDPGSRAETSTPVCRRKKPTPPMHPIRICLGKNPMRDPSLQVPIKKNTNPVRTELAENDRIVVAITDLGLS